MKSPDVTSMILEVLRESEAPFMGLTSLRANVAGKIRDQHVDDVDWYRQTLHRHIRESLQALTASREVLAHVKPGRACDYALYFRGHQDLAEDREKEDQEALERQGGLMCLRRTLNEEMDQARRFTTESGARSSHIELVALALYEANKRISIQRKEAKYEG
jgi:hypothetical protein